MKKYILTFCIFIGIQANSQTIFGKWQSFNEETGNADSIIEVYQKKDKAFAKIIKVLNKDREDAICDLCKGKNKNKRILGMDILSGLTKDDDEWSGGKIIDPRSGKEYKCYIKLEDNNTLKIRGFIGFSLFGKTAIWKRFTS